MFFENEQKIDCKEVSFFGRGTLADQISCFVETKIVGFFDDFDGIDLMKRDLPIIYAVGYKDLTQKNVRLKRLLADGYRVCSIAAENAIVSPQVKMGNGIIINQGAVIDNFVELKQGSFINIGVTVSHHTVVGECVFIGPGATIAGNVTIHQNVFIGANSTIINGISIGEGSVVAAGAVVTKDVPPFTLVAGVPAIIKKNFRQTRRDWREQ